MKFSTKCRYGTRALVEIGRNYGVGPTKRRVISRSQDISDSYLENILITLRNAGIIDTIRGARGGYVLVKDPSQITLFEVVKALEGSLAPVDCLDNSDLCERVNGCVTREVWYKVQVAKENVLKEVTLKELIEKDCKNNHREYVI